MYVYGLSESEINVYRVIKDTSQQIASCYNIKLLLSIYFLS